MNLTSKLVGRVRQLERQTVYKESRRSQELWCFRAVGAGPVGLAAAGHSIFSQLTHAKMPYELWFIVQF